MIKNLLTIKILVIRIPREPLIGHFDVFLVILTSNQSTIFLDVSQKTHIGLNIAIWLKLTLEFRMGASINFEFFQYLGGGESDILAIKWIF